MLGGIGPWELTIILAIVVVLFGAKKLPMIGDGLGKMITNFKKATKPEEKIESPSEPKEVSHEAKETS